MTTLQKMIKHRISIEWSKRRAKCRAYTVHADSPWCATPAEAVGKLLKDVRNDIHS